MDGFVRRLRFSIFTVFFFFFIPILSPATDALLAFDTTPFSRVSWNLLPTPKAHKLRIVRVQNNVLMLFLNTSRVKIQAAVYHRRGVSSGRIRFRAGTKVFREKRAVCPWRAWFSDKTSRLTVPSWRLTARYYSVVAVESIDETFRIFSRKSILTTVYNA